MQKIGYQFFLIIFFFQATVLNWLQIKRWVSKEYHPWWYLEMRIDLKLYPVLTSFLMPTKHLCEPSISNGSEASMHLVLSQLPYQTGTGMVLLYCLRSYATGMFFNIIIEVPLPIPTEIKLFSINIFFSTQIRLPKMWKILHS